MKLEMQTRIWPLRICAFVDVEMVQLRESRLEDGKNYRISEMMPDIGLTARKPSRF